jgi:hypothetical protein
MLALQRQLTRRSALVVISRFSSTDSSLLEAWEAKARKEAKGQDPYQVFGSKNHDVGFSLKYLKTCFKIIISMQIIFIFANNKD